MGPPTEQQTDAEGIAQIIAAKGAHPLQVHDNPVSSPVDAPTQWPLRNLRRLLEELIAIAHASRGREEYRIDLLPVGEEFDPSASV